MLKIKVKASSITNLTDARYFAAREVEWLGFPLGNGGDGLSPLFVKAMADWVDGVKIVGEFDLSTASEIKELSGQVEIDTVQVGMFTPLVDVRQLDGLSVIKEVVVEASTSADELSEHLSAFGPHVEFFLLNFSKTGLSWNDLKNGSPFPISFLQNICETYSILLEVDAPVNAINEILETVRPTGLSFAGGEEEKVGVKSFDDLDEMLDELEVPE